MLYPLLSLLLSIRMKQQYSNLAQFIIRRVPFFKSFSSKQYILFSCILDILFGCLIVFVISSYLYSPVYQIEWESAFVIFLFLFSIVKGIESYRRTHILPFEELIQLAPISARHLFQTLLFSELVWLLFTSLSTYLIYFLFQYFIAQTHDWIFWLKHLNVILTGFLLFIVSNKIFGAYIYNIVVKKIGIIRVLFFTSISLLFFLCGRVLISNIVFPFYYTFRQLFQSISSLAEDAFWITLSNNLMSLYQNNLQQIHHALFSQDSVFLQFLALFTSPVTFLVVILVATLVMKTPVRWIPTGKEHDQSSKHFRDLFYWYFQALDKIQSSLFQKNMLIQKDLKVLKEKRWLLSKEFFNYMFMSYEAFFYVGVMTGLISLIDHQALQIQLLFTLNVMILANQTYEMRMLTPSIFSLSAEKKNIWLYELSQTSLMQFFLSKIQLFYCLFSIPSLFLLFINLSIISVYHLFDVQILIQLVALGIGFFIFPLIQLYLFPFTTKFNFIHEHEIGTTNEEIEVIDKGQAFARNFLVLPFMYYMILTSFLPILQHSTSLISVLFALYFVIVSVICWVLCRKTIYKGIEYVEKNKMFYIGE
ncbi:hypothetical protein JNUCC24_11895 [Bacillus sp. JNUCC-24]|nr:hypothetical protein H7F25_10670 [Bacillus sp. PAMC28571]QNK44203.1 hypothetical protein H7F24_17235 [Bacillus sp. PAMC22265]QWS49221.1 hypothetical protein JNUCC24_11895 [Bacillus sp. JNUCC-24]